VGPRAGQDDVEKTKFFTLPGLEPRLLARPARSRTDCAIPTPLNIGLFVSIFVSFTVKICLLIMYRWYFFNVFKCSVLYIKYLSYK
jgi:hypothetical protein